MSKNRNYNKIPFARPQGEDVATVVEENVETSQTVDEVTETVEEPKAVKSEPVVEETLRHYGKVTNCVNLNVRKKPNKIAEVLCTIPNHSEVEIVLSESTYDWYKVRTASGVEGFCMRQYISIRQ